MKINEIETDIAPGEKRQFEPSNTDTSRSWDKFLSDCSDSIVAIKSAGKFLYRGITHTKMSGSIPDIFIGRPRTTRLALDTPESIQDAFDNQLKARNFTALRSNSIFCVSNVEYTFRYGRPYVIFPVNGFSFTWSPRISDLTEFLFDINVSDGDELEKYCEDDPKLMASYKQDDLISAIRSENEIYINGSYYAFSSEFYESSLRKGLQ